MLEINTGVVRIPIRRDGEDVGSIAFNPNDLAFANKFYSLYQAFKTEYKNFEKKSKKIEDNKELDEYGVPVAMGDAIKISSELCDNMYKQIDNVFGDDTSDKVFGGCKNPEVIHTFFEGVSPYFAEARENKVSKYMNREQKRAAGLK